MSTLTEQYDIAQRTQRIVTVVRIRADAWKDEERTALSGSLRPLPLIACRPSHPTVLLLRGRYDRSQLEPYLSRPFDVEHVQGLDNPALPFPPGF